tara:strand:- start:246 stop:458 length:213 start_codon:yes stop_codon:yes gene_type:complete
MNKDNLKTTVVLAEKKLLTTKDFQHEYGPCRSILYRMINEGQITGKKVGGRLFIDRIDAERWRKNLPDAD